MILTPSNDPLPTCNAKARRDVILRVRAPNVGVVSFCEDSEALTLQMRLFGVEGGLRWVRGGGVCVSPSRAHDAIGVPVPVENDVIPF